MSENVMTGPMTEIDLDDGQSVGDVKGADQQLREVEAREPHVDVPQSTNVEPAIAGSDATSVSSENENNGITGTIPADSSSDKQKETTECFSDNVTDSSRCPDETEVSTGSTSTICDLITANQRAAESANRAKDPEEQSISSNSETASNYVEDLRETRIRELTSLCEKQAKELCDLRARIEQQDAEARRYVAKLSEENKKRTDQLNKLYEECRAEKDTMVVKYAQAEQRCIEAQRAAERCDQRVRDAQRVAAANEQRVKQIQANQTRLQAQYDARCNEVHTLRSELERSREAVASTSNQLKWANTKLKEEQELHAICKQRFENAQKAVATQREEVTLLKQKYDECRSRLEELVASSVLQRDELAPSQNAVDTNESPTRTSDEIRSDSDSSVAPVDAKSQESIKKDSPARHGGALAAQAEELNVSSILLKEVDTLKRTVASLRDENAKLRELETRNETLRGENEKQLRRIAELESEVQRCESELCELARRCDAECSKLADSQTQLRLVSAARDDLSERLAELEAERVELCEKQSEMLSSIERTTGRATCLSARNAELNTRLEAAVSEAAREAERCRLAEARATDERATLERDVLVSRTQLSTTSAELERTKSELESLRKSHEDVLDTYAATRRKLEANLKDVTKQLERVKREMDALQSATISNNQQNNVASNSSNNKKATGSTSVSRKHDKEEDKAAWTNARTFDEESERALRSPKRVSPNQRNQRGSTGNEIPSVDIVDTHVADGENAAGSLPERMALVNKIVRLQNLHAAKIERIEFYKDHVRQLNDELRKKSRLIQYYLLREEAGRLNSASAIPVDPKKAHLAAKKPGILTQLYSQATGATPTQPEVLHLGEVNSKLQTLLEDTLVKNMTLKENLDTMSQEVARLTHEKNELRALLDKSDAFIRDRVTNLNMTFDSPPSRVAASNSAVSSSSSSSSSSAVAKQPGGHASQRKAQTLQATSTSAPVSGAYVRANLHNTN